MCRFVVNNSLCESMASFVQLSLHLQDGKFGLEFRKQLFVYVALIHKKPVLSKTLVTMEKRGVKTKL